MFSFIKNILPPWLPIQDFYVGLGVATFMVVVMALMSNYGPRGRQMARIKVIQERQQILRGEMTDPKKRRRPEKSVSLMRTVATKLQLVRNLQIGKAEDMLVEGGFRSKDALLVMSFFVMVLPIVLGIIGFIVMQMNLLGAKLKIFDYLWPVLGLYIGLKLPWVYVSRVRKKRYHRIRQSLSDVLDLMTICAEAGLSLSAALDRVSKELAVSYPEIAEELTLTSVELGFLPDRNQALSNLAKRCGLQEIRGIVSVLIQTEKYGTPIAQALRTLSAEFRQARMLRAEEKAARLPALMTVPMILFILPTLFIVIMAPAIIKLFETTGG